MPYHRGLNASIWYTILQLIYTVSVYLHTAYWTMIVYCIRTWNYFTPYISMCNGCILHTYMELFYTVFTCNDCILNTYGNILHHISVLGTLKNWHFLNQLMYLNYFTSYLSKFLYWCVWRGYCCLLVRFYVGYDNPTVAGISVSDHLIADDLMRLLVTDVAFSWQFYHSTIILIHFLCYLYEIVAFNHNVICGVILAFEHSCMLNQSI